MKRIMLTIVTMGMLAFVAEASMIAEWNFDNQNANDASGNGHHGSPVNGLTFESSPEGYAARVPYNGHYVSVTDANPLRLLDDGWRIDVRVFVDPDRRIGQHANDAFAMTMVSKGGAPSSRIDYTFLINDSNGDGIVDRLQFATGQGPTGGAVHSIDDAVQVGQWFDASVLWYQGSVMFLVDGQEVGYHENAYAANELDNWDTNRPVTLGRRYPGNHSNRHLFPLDGALESVKYSTFDGDFDAASGQAVPVPAVLLPGLALMVISISRRHA